jgi:hypothetical protein
MESRPSLSGNDLFRATVTMSASGGSGETVQKCRINPALDEGCYQEVGEGTEINRGSIEDALPGC